MAFELDGRRIEKVGVVGAGQIGPDIALHFAETLGPQGVGVVVVDIAEAALAAARARLQKKLDKQVAGGKLKPEKAQALLSGIQFTLEYEALRGAALVVEAATENLPVKQKIFGTLAELCGPDAIFTSNSSHLPPAEIFAGTPRPERCAVTHYFYPAEKNPVVEVVPGERTDVAVTRFLMGMYELAGKLPVNVGGRYGFAVDPVFEGLFLAAALAVEGGMATVEQVDAVCQKALGQGVGPFTAMNLTGGNPLTNIGLTGYHTHIMPFFRSPALLKAQLEKGAPWPMAGKDVKVEVDEATFARVSDWMLGAYFGLTTEILDAGLIALSDFDEVLGLALAMHPAFTLMNEKGLGASLALVERFAAANPGFKVSARLKAQAEQGAAWPLESVSREDRDGVAILTLRRFKVLNALNAGVIDQLERHVAAIEKDASVTAVVVRGFGTRAFVSGADIRELSVLKTPADAVAKARRGQVVLRRLEQLGKPVIAAMNGLAFGGGNELAMACHARLAVRGQKVFVGQPEPKLGIVPGYGGTQRLPRWIGMEAAWPLLRTGEPIGSARALELGLIREEVAPEHLLARAVELAREAAAGRVKLSPIPEGPIPVPEALPEVGIGGLSTCIDRLLVKATLDGARSTLDRGLELEAEAFGECMLTEDVRLGMENFIKNGPKVAAQFAHR